jgi:hypothetical protein
MSNNTGESVFSGLEAEKIESSYGGIYVQRYKPVGELTLRDYFAAKACTN